MAHDYQYWRVGRRTSTAPWRFFSGRSGGADVPPDVANPPPIQTQIVDPQRTPRRVTSTAPWRFSNIRLGGASVPKDLLSPQAMLPHRVPGARRAAQTEYIRRNQIRIPDEVPQNGRIYEPRLTYQRAARTEYWHPNLVQIKEDPPQQGRILFPVPPYRRTATEAYFVNPKAVVADVTTTPPISQLITDFARRAPRTANTAYWQALRFQIGDEVPQNGRLFDLILPHRRTAGSVYTQLVPLQIAEGLPQNSRLFDLILPYRRSANSVYTQTVPVQLSEPLPKNGTLADPLQAYRRAAQSAYWRNSEFVVPDVVLEVPAVMFSGVYQRTRPTPNMAPWRYIGGKAGGIDVIQEVPLVFPAMFDFRREKLRSARESYELHQARQISLLFQPEGKILYPDIANTFGRKLGANTAYWRHNAGAIPVISFPEELSAKMIPVKQWLPLRPANSVYWKDNFGPIPVVTFPEEFSAKVIPSRAPGQRRTGASAYFVNSRYTEVTTDFPMELRPALFPSRAPGSRRAAEMTYWIPPKFLTEFPRALEPLIISKGRALVLRATERDFNIPAKRRVYKPKPKRP